MQIQTTSEAKTGAVAAALAPRLRRGDVIALGGDLGTGKSAFARALINALPGDIEDVPSPTFTLVQTYARGDMDIWHFDLYRLEDPEEAFELGIEDAFADAVSLIEWPDRLGGYLPRNALSIQFVHGPENENRRITFTGDDAWRARLKDLNGVADAPS